MKKLIALLAITGLSLTNIAYAKNNASACKAMKHSASASKKDKKCCGKKSHGKCKKSKTKSSSTVPNSPEDITK